MKKSMAYSIHPIAAALAKGLEFIGGDLHWTAQGVNKERQQSLLNVVKQTSPEDFQSLNMQTIASYSADEINHFLAENGFDISLNQFNPGEFGVASVLKILMTWLHEGQECIINAKNGKKYKGVKMGVENVELFVSLLKTDELIVRIKPNEDFSLYLATFPRPIDEQTLLVLAKEFSRTKQKDANLELESLWFPEVEINTQPDISWLCGLSAEKNVITQALMQTKFLLDKKGAKAEAAAAFGIRKCIVMSKKISLVLDKPFIAWIEKPGIDMPVFAAWCDYDSWKQI